MSRWHIWLIPAALLLPPASVHAAEKIIVSIGSNGEDSNPVTTASFAYESCPEECHVATLSCEGNVVTVELGDVSAAHAAKAITEEQKQIVLSASGQSFNYTIRSMQYAEMTGSWWLSASEQGSAVGAIQSAIAGAKTVDLLAGGMTVSLPVDKAVRDWAMACK